MFVTYLSNRKPVNSSSLFIPSLSFSAQKLLKAKLRFTHSGMNFICLMFLLTRGIFPFLRRYILICSFLWSEWSESTLNLTCVLLLAGGNTPTPNPGTSRLTKTSKSRQRAELCRHSDHNACREDREWWLTRIYFVYLFIFWKMLLTVALKSSRWQ